MRTNSERIEQIKEREKAATKGPWYWDRYYIRYEGDTGFNPVADDGSAWGEYDEVLTPDSPDGQFIAHSRADIPWLLSQLEEAQAEVADSVDTIAHWRKFSQRMAETLECYKETNVMLETARELKSKLASSQKIAGELAEQLSAVGLLPRRSRGSAHSRKASRCGWPPQIGE